MPFFARKFREEPITRSTNGDSNNIIDYWVVYSNLKKKKYIRQSVKGFPPFLGFGEKTIAGAYDSKDEAEAQL